jgi:hypothetical protein
MGAELRKAEGLVHAKVDSLVGAEVAAARAKVSGLESEVRERLAVPQQQLQDIEAQLKEALGRVTGTVRPRLPTLPAIPRPRP